MKKALLWVMFLLLFPLAACGEVYSVSPQGMSVTQALALCRDGDVLELGGGIYDEGLESFPIVIDKAVVLRAAEGQSPVIDAPAFKAALRVEADGVALEGLDIRFRRTGVYAIGSDLRMEGCRVSLADPAWRTSSCGIWCGGIYRMTLRDCAFAGCSIALAGPPLSESSKGKPVLTGLFEVGEDPAYFTSHTIEGCTVNGKPLFYAACQARVEAPENAGQIICCGCDEVIIRSADVSDASMGMVLTYNRSILIENSRADRCGVFGIYAAKCEGGLLNGCSAVQTNHGLDIRASRHMILQNCTAADCDQGLFFSFIKDSAMIACTVTGTGQGYFLAAGSGNTLKNCAAINCENGFNLQKEGHVLMHGCTAQGCTVCGVRLDATPAAFASNTLRDNWVAVMAYGGAQLDLADNLFEGSRCCGLYLRDIAYSRFSGNTFSGSGQASVQVIGTLDGSVWLNNTLDKPMEAAQADEGFGLLR